MDQTVAKSLRLNKAGSRACRNPFCRAEFTAKRRDQRFCSPTCKKIFFKVKYGLEALAQFFDLDLTGQTKT